MGIALLSSKWSGEKIDHSDRNNYRVFM